MSANERCGVVPQLDGNPSSICLSELASRWKASKSGTTAALIVRELDAAHQALGLPTVRLKILRSYTVEPIVPWLRAEALVHGLDLQVRVGGFGSFAHEILDPDTNLYNEPLDVILLATQTRDWTSAIWTRFADLDRDAVFHEQNHVLRDLETMISVLRSRTSATLLVSNFDLPATPRLGLADTQTEFGQTQVIAEMNRRLAAIVRDTPGAYLVDYDGLVCRFGRMNWVNENQWQTTRLPVASAHIGDLAHEWARHVRVAVLPSRKVLVTDLDNTLWGGVLGEVGAEGIVVGREHPGWRYQQIQRALLDLHRRGILLTIASKNDHTEALECIDSHPEMLLRSRHFSAVRINWNDKAQSVEEIAAELSVGIDSLVFLDDNPVERENVRLRRPEVHVIDLPADPAGFAAALQSDPSFDSLALTEDDRSRNRYYAQQRERRTAEDGTRSREEFLEILGQKVKIARADNRSSARIAELTRKTNQLNLTTRRYSPAEIGSMVQARGVEVLTVRVEDRFGDNGIVGVAILRKLGQRVEIDTLLLSCRVIGRMIETAVLSYLVDFTEEWGATEIVGWFRPTAKNAPTKEVYREHGFRKEKDGPDGQSFWRLQLKDTTPGCPVFIELCGEIPVHG